MTRIKDSVLKTEYLREARALCDMGQPITPIIQAYARDLHVSMQAAYKTFKAAGLLKNVTKSGKPRKERSDKGKSVIPKEDAVKVASLQLRAKRRAAGKRGLPQSEAVKHLTEEGVITPASTSTYNRRLKGIKLDQTNLKAAEPYIILRSLAPGDVFQIDASQAIQWYLKEGVLKPDPDKAILEYKTDKNREGVLKRYIVVDHYTGAFWVMYVYKKGETAGDYLRALWEACRWKGEDFPLSGLPRLLYSDAGAGLTAKVAQRVFNELGVEYQHHKKGNPRAKGAVESRHGWWEAIFEAKLLALGQTHFSLNELNGMAFEACKRWNYERPVSRTGRPPFELWKAFDALHPEIAHTRRYPPEWKIMEEIQIGGEHNGRIFGDWTVRFEHRTYDLSRLRNYTQIQPRGNIKFCRDPKCAENIIVDTPDGLRHVVSPLVMGMDGRPVDAPVLGMEYKSKPDDLATKARKEALAMPLPEKPAADKIITVKFVTTGGEPTKAVVTKGSEPEITAPARIISRFEWIERFAANSKCDLRAAADEYRSRYGDAESAPQSDTDRHTESDSATNNENQKGD